MADVSTALAADAVGGRIGWQIKVAKKYPNMISRAAICLSLGIANFACIALLTATSAGCSSQSNELDIESNGSEAVAAPTTFTAKGTGYYPDSSALEGGFFDRIGKRLCTLQDFVAGKVPYVSVAMDKEIFPYGTRLKIKELNEKYGKDIDFRVVDTGSAFQKKRFSRIDICTANRSASVDGTVNGMLTIEVRDASGGIGAPAATPTEEALDTSPSDGTCTNDGTCNPGQNGSGKICASGKCVAGCKINAHCPGITTCVSGSCR